MKWFLAILLTALPVLASAQDDEGLPLDVSAGGFCTGLAWVAVEDGTGLSVDRGPDFRVFRYDRSTTEWWGIYSGQHAQVSRGKKTLLFQRDGIRVDRVEVEGRFRGYLAVNEVGLQNHFFGSPFKDEPGDRAFFDAVDFSATGQANCKEHPLA